VLTILPGIHSGPPFRTGHRGLRPEWIPAIYWRRSSHGFLLPDLRPAPTSSGSCAPWPRTYHARTMRAVRLGPFDLRLDAKRRPKPPDLPVLTTPSCNAFPRSHSIGAVRFWWAVPSGSVGSNRHPPEYRPPSGAGTAIVLIALYASPPIRHQMRGKDASPHHTQR
jgi:hypothetical protein